MDRRFLIASLAFTPWIRPALAGELLSYRGFNVDISELSDIYHRYSLYSGYDLVDALKHQLDIIADSGIKPAILDYFRAEHIALRGELQSGSRWRVGPTSGLELGPATWAATDPVVLRGLLVPYMATLPSDAMARIADFYAEGKRIAAPGESFVYLAPETLRAVQLFFAQTASLYLYGTAESPPFERKTLKDKQPNYCDWLSQAFGVRK
jgi:hypothetical protein